MKWIMIGFILSESKGSFSMTQKYVWQTKNITSIMDRLLLHQKLGKKSQ